MSGGYQLLGKFWEILPSQQLKFLSQLTKRVYTDTGVPIYISGYPAGRRERIRDVDLE